MKGEPLFRGMRDACFYGDFHLLEGGRVFIPQHTDRQYALGANFHQIIDFNDLPTSLFACNVHQSVFEEKNGKRASGLDAYCRGSARFPNEELQCKNHNHWNVFNQECSNSTGDTGVKLFKNHFKTRANPRHTANLCLQKWSCSCRLENGRSPY
ncbi:UNVERIFIED_CONTAM: hypothetical protein FKN15_045439 [Acipenser sinensis]